MENLLIDPFLKGGPFDVDLASVKCDVVCITHDHPDHMGGAFDIAKANNATLVGVHELAVKAKSEWVTAEGMNLGGWLTVGDWKIKMVPALHSCGEGTPAGYILHHLPSNKKIYHAGDTALFSDMRLIGEEGIDIALLPIGDRYTMGIDDAVKAVALIEPKIIIPIHYNTVPPIKADPHEFKNKVLKMCEEKCGGKCGFVVEIMNFNDEKEF